MILHYKTKYFTKIQKAIKDQRERGVYDLELFVNEFEIVNLSKSSYLIIRLEWLIDKKKKIEAERSLLDPSLSFGSITK